MNIPTEILRRIPKVKKITARELHEQLASAGIHREKRTIERHLVSLSKLFDIELDDSAKPYGYRWKPNAQGLFLPGLTAQEALLLLLAKAQLAPLLPASLIASLGSILDQADRKLRNAQWSEHASEKERQSRRWLDKIRVLSTTVPMLPPTIAEGVFEAVSEALYVDHWLDITYQNAQGEVRERKVMPLGLAQQGQRMFLVCRFDGYDNYRNLALHRIQAARDTGLPFDRPADFDLKVYDDNGRFDYGDGEFIRMSVWVSSYLALLLAETPLSSDQTLAPMPEPRPARGSVARDGARLEATVIQSALLVRWLRSHGNGAKVLGPPSLVELM
jgi:predicted DNA-binding transcriptional regulator YafY